MTASRMLRALLAGSLLAVPAAPHAARAAEAAGRTAHAAPAARAAAYDTLPVPALRLPSAVERTLPNGLRVVVLRDDRQPIVHVQLLVPAGSGSEPEDQQGVAPLTAALLRQGTASRSPGEFAAELAQLGAIFATQCERDYALVACGVRSASLENALDLMSDAVTSPTFGGDRFEELRAATARELGQRHGTLGDLADLAIAEAAFGQNPYAHAPSGDPRTLVFVDLAAVHAFHRDRWRPDHAVLTIAGDVTPERAFAAAADWFGRWSGVSAPEPARPAPKPAAGVTLVDAPDAPYAEVRLGILGPGLGSPGYDAWALAMAGLDEVALPAGAVASHPEARDASLLVISARADLDQAAALVRELQRVLREYHAAPVRPGALDSLRRRVARRYPLTIGTLGSLTTQWQSLDFSGGAAGSIATLGDRISSADLAVGKRAFKFATDVVVAGPAARLQAEFKDPSFGPTNVRSLDEPAVGTITAQAAPSAVDQARGRQLVAAAITAHGGTANLRAVHSIVTEGTITMRVGGQDLAGQFSAARLDPDHYSFATKVLQLSSRQILAGDQGWKSVGAEDSASVTSLDSLGRMRLRAAAAEDLVHQLRFAADSASGAAWRGTGDVAGHACDLVEYDTPFGRHRLSLDQKTRQVLEIDSGPAARGAWLDHRVLSDYRPTEGLLLAWTEDRTLAGERVWRMSARVVGVNTDLPKGLFDRPVSAK